MLVGDLLVLERTGLIEIDEKAIQPEVVSCQVGHNDMKVHVQGEQGLLLGRGCPEVRVMAPPRLGGAPCTTGTGPKRGRA